jgi:hypothetical protein
VAVRGDDFPGLHVAWLAVERAVIFGHGVSPFRIR